MFPFLNILFIHFIDKGIFNRLAIFILKTRSNEIIQHLSDLQLMDTKATLLNIV